MIPTYVEPQNQLGGGTDILSVRVGQDCLTYDIASAAGPLKNAAHRAETGRIPPTAKATNGTRQTVLWFANTSHTIRAIVAAAVANRTTSR